jgi:hypothetical protein
VTTEHLPEPGDTFDVFVVRGRRNGKLTGYLCKATAIWNGSTQLLPYSRAPELGGFTVTTDSLKHGIRFDGRTVHYYLRPKAVVTIATGDRATHSTGPRS